LLEKSREAVLMAATAGKTAMAARDSEIKAGNGSAALIIDAVASETADAGLDWIQEFLNGQLARQGRKLTNRYSPGYGDLDLSAQKIIYDALDLEKIGISITDRFILAPEKSVLAIAGIV
jgi:cobalamin-dependent methionine synthase I